ncbi:antitoxin Xre/MbcA/ParS toxin-binding domain-containing protein [Oligoflexus tunisiensis]|uniref:antitoxin Xre/MbcA/ParS toxin-binding domain-containing protein n=1 Tax=Oligoflexus tunisiensis TaxID=708132 RepID=UPI00114D2B93|nr:antitoxin Xre/MbcA/ParS toxin-binding domain-containing protein [Oligoflexus tunisiensis]
MSVKSKQAMSDAERAEKQNRAVCRAIFVTRQDLGLKTVDLAKILDVNVRTINRWENEELIPGLDEKRHLREAASHLIAIFRSLAAMFSSAQDREAWIKTAHPELVDAPLEIMKGSMEGLIQVRRYLDYVRGRGA